MSGQLKKLTRLFKLQAGRCVLCNNLMTQDRFHQNTASIEHICPRSRGGTTANWNIVAACWTCNAMRGNGPFGIAQVSRIKAVLEQQNFYEAADLLDRCGGDYAGFEKQFRLIRSVVSGDVCGLDTISCLQGRINKFRKWGANWDAEGAEKPVAALLDIAEQMLPTFLGLRMQRIKITLTPEGHPVFFIDTKKDSGEVRLNEDGSVDVFFDHGPRLCDISASKLRNVLSNLS